jgi:ATP-binding cassette, subfamily B (MDR/TAP), member 1
VQAITVISVAFLVGCFFSWELTLVTASGLVAIVMWYSFITPLVVRKYVAMQEVEREASGVVREALAGIRMVAACGADEKIAGIYNGLVDRVAKLGNEMSPLLALQHAPGTSLITFVRRLLI